MQIPGGWFRPLASCQLRIVPNSAHESNQFLQGLCFNFLEQRAHHDCVDVRSRSLLLGECSFSQAQSGSDGPSTYAAPDAARRVCERVVVQMVCHSLPHATRPPQLPQRFCGRSHSSASAADAYIAAASATVAKAVQLAAAQS